MNESSQPVSGPSPGAGPEAGTPERYSDDARPRRRPQRGPNMPNQGGGRGRMPQGRQSPGGHMGPPGLGQQRQYQQHQGWPQDGPRYQPSGPVSDLVVGTQLQGFVDHVRETFGFIRVADAGELVFFHVSEVLPEEKPPPAATPPAQQPNDEALAADGQATGTPGQQQPDLADGGAARSQPQEQGPLPQQPAQEGARPVQDAERRRQRDADLSELLQPGDPVEFTVAASSQDGVRHKGNRAPKMMAKLVRRLPPGTLAPVSVGEERLQGRVEKALVGGGAASDTWTNREASGGQGGLLSYVDPDAARSGAVAPEAAPAAATPNGEDSNGGAPPRVFLPFEGADVKGRGARQLKRGDPVEFSISTDARTGKRRATQVQAAVVQKPAEAPAGPREQGFVDRFVNTYGFVRSIDREGQPPMFFHISEVAGGQGAGLKVGSEVSFSVVPDPTAGRGADKWNAVALELLPDGTLAEERRWPGRVKGRIVRPAARAEAEGQAPSTGKLTFEDDVGNVRTCSYALDQVRGDEEVAASFGAQDEVEFEVIVNRRSGGHRAEAVQLLCRAQDRRELGQVKQLHEGKEPGAGFGFIRPCERAGDLFFHMSQVSGADAGELQVGDDVEFSMVPDPTPDAPKRVVASRVTKAPKGSAVFDVVGERVYAGVVLERMHAKGTNITSGLVQYADEAGAPAKLTYGPRDLLDPKNNPKPLDHVTFRLAVHPRAVKAAEKVGGVAAQHAGRRATQVALVSYSGRVVNFKGTFGFLEYDPSRGSAAAAAGASAPNGTEKAADKGTEKGGGAPNGAPAAQSGSAGEEGSIAADGASPAADKGGAAAKAQQLPRLYFHGSDMEGGTPLKPGDEVRFTLANKPSRIGEATPGPGGQGAGAAGGGADKDRGPGGGPAGGPPRELIARRVVRTKEAPVKEEEAFVAERNPQAIKFTNNLAQQGGAAKSKDAVRMARGPDGTRGFAPGRGRPLPPAPAAGSAPPPAAPGSATMLRIGSSGALNPTAAAFVPRAASKDLGAAAAAAPSSSPAAKLPTLAAPEGPGQSAAAAPAPQHDSSADAAAVEAPADAGPASPGADPAVAEEAGPSAVEAPPVIGNAAGPPGGAAAALAGLSLQPAAAGDAAAAHGRPAEPPAATVAGDASAASAGAVSPAQQPSPSLAFSAPAQEAPHTSLQADHSHAPADVADDAAASPPAPSAERLGTFAAGAQQGSSAGGRAGSAGHAAPAPLPTANAPEGVGHTPDEAAALPDASLKEGVLQDSHAPRAEEAQEAGKGGGGAQLPSGLAEAAGVGAAVSVMMQKAAGDLDASEGENKLRSGALLGLDGEGAAMPM